MIATPRARVRPRWQPAAGLLALLFLTASGSLAQPSPLIDRALLERPWTARWISHPTADRTAYGVFFFRHTIDLDTVPAQFVVHVSADNRYRLYVNGTSVSHGPARGDIENWRYETVDLAPYLQPGTNVLAAVVWNYAEHRPVAQWTRETAFLLQGNTEQESAVNTDARWQVLQSRAHAPIPVDRSRLGFPWRPYIVVGPGEAFDARAYPWGWTTGEDAEEGWQPALELRGAVPKWGHHHDIYLAWKLIPREIPPMEEHPQRIPAIRRSEGMAVHEGFLSGTSPLEIPAGARVSLLLDQTYLTTGYPVLRTSGGRDATVTLTYAEALFDERGRKGNRNDIEGKAIYGYQDRFVLDGGAERTMSTLWWRTWRYLRVEIETAAEPLILHDLHGLFTAYPFEQRASFAGSDDSLRDIWDVSWRTARLCAGETYFDCPYYEQLQYAGDTRIQALISLYVAGDDRLMRKAIEHFHDSRMPDGLTESRAPAWEEQYIPPYSLLWIAMIHDYWMHRPDSAFVARYLTGIRGVLEWYERYIDDTGMLGPMPWWNFVDWAYPRGVPPGADDGHSTVVTLQYIYVLRMAADLAEAFGRSEEAAYYRQRAASLGEATYRLAWNEARGLLADTPEQTVFSQHANAMAILTDLIPLARQPEVMQRVLSDTSLVQTTYYYRFYVTRAMKKAGQAAEYLRHLGPWREMLDLGLTTFAEEPDPTRSDCHAWSASPNYDFLATVLGIEPASPGFATVQVAPALGSLTWAEGRMPHPSGTIEVRLRRAGARGLEGDVVLPDGVTGTFVWNGRSYPLQGGPQTIALTE